MTSVRFPAVRPPFLIAFDLDGTLIPDGGNDVPEVTQRALERLRQCADVRLAVITGRDVVPPQVMQAMHPDAVVTNNGGRIELGGVMHSEATFSDADLEGILAHELDDACVSLFTNDQLFLDLPTGTKPQAWMSERSFLPMRQAPREGVVKIGYFHPDISDFAARLRQSHPHLVLTGAHPPYQNYLAVTPAGAHKGAGLTLVAEALGIALSHTVACGDSDNDVAMLEIAGFAVQSGDLPLLTPYADYQVSGPEALGQYLMEWAKRLE